MGRIGHAYLTVVHASREGARLGVLGKSDTEIFEAVRRASGALPEEKLDIAVTPPASSRMRGRPSS